MHEHDLVVPRPAVDEAAPFYHGYIAGVPDERIAAHMSAQLQEVDQLLDGLDDSGARARYAPGKWSVKEVLGHIVDAERVFAYRLFRIARGDRTSLSGFDENAFVAAAGFDERPLADLLAEFRAARRSTLAGIAGIAPASWPNLGEANGRAVSARALAYIIPGHASHHLGVLRDRYGLGRR
jgi:hypothetical protein